MGKTQIVAILLFAFLEPNVLAGEWKSIDLEGKFVTRNGRRQSETLFSGKAGMKEIRTRRDTLEEPQLEFTGKITLKSERRVQVIGVNSTFTLFRLDGGRSRGKRSPTEKRFGRSPNNGGRIGLHGQFSLQTPMDSPPEVIDLLIQFDVKQLSQTKIPREENVKLESRLEFNFNGSLSLKEGDEEGAALVYANLGVKNNRERNKRLSGNPSKATMNIDGELTIDDVSSRGPTMLTVCSVNGEITVAKVVPPAPPTPKEELFSSTKRNEFNLFFETAGTATGKIGGKPVFVSPFSTNVRTTFETLRDKREEEAGNDKVLELDYYGTIPAGIFFYTPHKLGISAKFKLWEISTTRISNEI